jgi:hypothetical protein
MGLAWPLVQVRHDGCSGVGFRGGGGTCSTGHRALVIYGAHAHGVLAWRGSVAATPNDAAAFTHVLVCPVVGSQHKERTFMMNHADGWMGGWAGGGMLLWAVLAVLVVVVVLIKSLIRKK